MEKYQKKSPLNEPNGNSRCYNYRKSFHDVRL